MRILTIGNSHSASVFTQCLCANKDHLVFSTRPDTDAAFLDILPSNVAELKDFAVSNDIELTVVCDIELMSENFTKEFNEAHLTIFTPDPDALKIVSSRGFGRKFMYKNKIQTPKFAIHDKMQMAVDYARAANFPLVISSDDALDKPQTFKTFAKALVGIEKLFDEGAKKVVLSNFVEGKKFSYYVLTDGYNILPLDSVEYFKEKFAYVGVTFLDHSLENRILNTVIRPALSALERFSSAYVGVLAVDFILTDRNELFATEFRSFFSNLDVALFMASIREDWAKLFNSAIVGSLLDDYEGIYKSKECYIVAEKDGEYILEEGSTLNQAREKLAEFDDINEVISWKF